MADSGRVQLGLCLLDVDRPVPGGGEAGDRRASGYPLGNADRAAVADLMRSILPIEPRSAGCVFDVFVTNLDMAVHPEKYPLEEITAPTLLVNAADDPLAKYELARAGSRRIPGAKLLTVPRGGHVFLGSGDFVRKEVTSFLRGAFYDR